ncbi:MAG: hypothetical protein CBD18_00160 [Opitutales bacterium TMED158]|nr:MAG: hypothetical protein CBD18_00160 [Opitutales bacterium TMED158]
MKKSEPKPESKCSRSISSSSQRIEGSPRRTPISARFSPKSRGVIALRFALYNSCKSRLESFRECPKLTCKSQANFAKRQSQLKRHVLNKKILIVRSDKEDAIALSFLLSGTGYRISSHSSADSALAAARQDRYDLAIADKDLPENRKELTFVAELKETQPNLPVFLISDKPKLDDVIDCIRAGVTEIIDEPKNMKRVFESTNEFFKGDKGADDDVTWEDMVAVEQALSSLFRKDTETGADTLEVEAQRLTAELEKAQSRIKNLEHSHRVLTKEKDKTDALVEEIRNSGGVANADSADYVERQTQMRELEARLMDREAKIAKQKAEAEILMADLEERQFEMEENGHVSVDKGATEIQKTLDAAQLEWNATRLDLEAQITDLNRELERAKVSSNDSESIKDALRDANEVLQESKEEIAEKDFILEQRDKEIEKLKEQLEVGQVAIQTIEDLEEAKRQLEIGQFKLQEDTDKFEQAKRSFEEDIEKRQRELDVNKRDAEVSLRELQNQVKEEQLKLKVEEATFKDEVRQFEQAKQNFQEDIQDLQSRESDLKQFEDQLKQMKSDLDDVRALPRGASEPAAKESNAPESTAPPPVQTEANPISRQNNAPPAPEGPKDDKFAPKTWNKPPRKSKNGRGPLRIGGRQPN